ncbi:MAG: colanic acid biosynthesis acetyltransferase WcaF [Cyanobacteria bacterium SW_9_44_58]|nr:MAG: colanic acid biosynthesis acetyltransferase WcaF [Cyanobacteria bacterium SW_9_44_58]
MYLKNYTAGDYTPGASFLKQLLWYFIGCPLVRSYWLPFSEFKVFLLKLFGAEIGQGVRIKPGVLIKFPWRLSVANDVWFGENLWIDNLAQVTIESNVCLSQGVYLCTGNHSWRDPNFRLITEPIALEEGSWIAARAVIGPGVTVKKGAVLGLGSVASRSLEAMTIYMGNPAQPMKARIIGN